MNRRPLTVRSRSRSRSHGLLAWRGRIGWLVALALVLPLATFFYVARTPTAGLLGAVIAHGPRGGEKIVALTFDDGPNDPYTGQILDVLKTANVHATFFIVGMNAEREPDTVRRIVAEGNDLGNHSYAHRKRDALLDFGYHDAARTSTILRGITSVTPRWYRAPNGFHTPWSLRAARDRGMQAVAWDVESSDWDEPGAEVIARRTVGQVHPGSIILLHDGDSARLGADRSQQIEAVRQIITQLQGQGYRFVTLTEMLGHPQG